MITVLIVEDSASARELLVHILGTDPGIEVIGTAANGEQAIQFLSHTKPDVLTMDIIMPGIDGLEATRRIMETDPVPIIIISSHWDLKEVSLTFRALEAGALVVMEKPVGIDHPDFDKMAGEIVRKIKVISKVKAIKRRARLQPFEADPLVSTKPGVLNPGTEIKVVAMGGSTGAPLVFQKVLSLLPTDFPVPIIAVQHIAQGFIEGMVKWLCQSSGFPVCVAVHGETAVPGRCYFAPDGFHLGLDRNGTTRLSTTTPENGCRPSVSYLFRSIASNFGKDGAGVLLTGMGTDGAMELKQLKEKGAVTIAQNKASSVVHGMPGKAIENGGAGYKLNPEEIALILKKLAGTRITAGGKWKRR